MVSSAEDERTASRVAVERAAEALGVEIAVLFRNGEVVACAGPRHDPAIEAALADVADGQTARLMGPGVDDRAGARHHGRAGHAVAPRARA